MNDLTIIELPDGTARALGNNPGVPRLKWTYYGDTDKAPLIPRAEWKDRIDAKGGPSVESSFLSPVHDQGPYGMCNASATCSAMESQRLKQGLPLVQLSGGDLYYRICGDRNSEDGGGSTLEDGIAEVMRGGVSSVAVVPYLEWRRTTAAATDDRKRYRVLEAYLCPTFDHCMSAVLMEFDLISGIWWYEAYGRVGGDGWLPAPGGRRGGHAVHGYRGTYRGSGASIEYGIPHKNSWTTRFGLNGLCVFPERVYKSPEIGGWWAVRSVVDEGGVVPPEKT